MYLFSLLDKNVTAIIIALNMAFGKSQLRKFRDFAQGMVVLPQRTPAYT